jgi:hypothetical protein
MAILSAYSETYLPMFTALSAVIYTGIFVLIYRYSPIPWLSVISFLSLGVFVNSLNFMRQIIAAIVVAFAVRYIGEREPFKYLLLALIASVFHWSALIMLPFYVILRVKPGVFSISVYAAALTLILVFSNHVMEFVTDTFYVYNNYDPATSQHMLVGIPAPYTLMFLIPLVICMLFKKRLIAQNPMNACYLNCLIFAVFFMVIGIKHSIISRFALLFVLPPVIALLPDAFNAIKAYIGEKFPKSKLKLGIVFSYAALTSAVFCYLRLVHVNYNGVTPYKSIINMSPEQLYRQENTESDADAAIELTMLDENDPEEASTGEE